MEKNYNQTMIACFTGYICQAIVNNFVPLLFITFQDNFHIPLSQITLLVTFNFLIQLIVDVASIFFVDKIGYRISMVLAHFFCALGLILLTILPTLISPFIGLLLSVMIYAIGGGLLEVLVSPVMEACPTKHKEKAMSLLHSFYCWGVVGVIGISTLFFHFIGIEHWKILAIIWSIIPIYNGIRFLQVPIYSLLEENQKELSLKEIISNRLFWILVVMMICAGASEQSVSQWASAFVQSGLGISKSIGDLAGPMSFAILMGTSRAIYGKYGDKINLDYFMKFSCLLCIISYLGVSLLSIPILNLICLALCGLSVGIMWPGTFSKASKSLPNGSTMLFAFLALAGDLGCSSGPTLVGFVSSLLNDQLKIGLFVATLFPILLLFGIQKLKQIK